MQLLIKLKSEKAPVVWREGIAPKTGLGKDICHVEAPLLLVVLAAIAINGETTQAGLWAPERQFALLQGWFPNRTNGSIQTITPAARAGIVLTLPYNNSNAE